MKIMEGIERGIDRAIGIFNPKARYKREAYRQAISAFTVYKGADRSRLYSDWLASSGSADSDLLFELKTLRERSRDLNRNDAHASGITNTITTNTVGTGIVPQARINAKNLGLEDQEKIEELQTLQEDIWEKWVPFADVQNRMDFFEIQSLVDRQILENGEAILMPVMIDDQTRPYSLALDVIESDRLESPFGKANDPKIRGGVQLGDRGEPTGYWIREFHPGDIRISRGISRNIFRFIPAESPSGRKNIFHLYPVLRPGQSRGVPFFAPVMNYFKNLADYMEAELVAARIAACFAIFIKKEDAYGAALGRTQSTNAKGQKLEAMEPGIIEYLSPGEDITSFNPNRPGGNFEPFVDRMLRAICAALNLPYELVAKDFSKTNYSSARASLLEARRYFKCRQIWLTRKLCQPVWEMLMEEAYLRSELPIQNFYENKKDYCRARWITPGWAWVDPMKEAESSELAIQTGVSTLADENAAQGRDWEETLEQRAREAKKIKELESEFGVQLSASSKKKEIGKEERPDEKTK